MRLHHHLCADIVIRLYDIFVEGFYADKVIERAFKLHPKWGSKDRHFVAETIYEMVRHWRLINFIAGQPDEAFSKNEWGEIELWTLLGVFLRARGNSLPPWTEFDQAQTKKVPSLEKVAQDQAVSLVTRQSIPDWLNEVGLSDCGDRWQKELEALNQPAKVVLRANSLKTELQDLKKKLSEEGISAFEVAGYENALTLEERKNVFSSKAFKDGLFEVQDAASQQVAPLLEVSPGMRVVDACAGAGGKTLHLAAIMKNKGKILALDVHENKLLELRKRAARAGADLIETHLIGSQKVIKRLQKTADRVLLDVPCSGLGVLRRNPSSKWKLTLKDIDEVIVLQREILKNYSSMVKPGGLLVYATCSLLRRENEDQVEWFSKEMGWQIEKKFRHWPSEGFDGFFAAQLRCPNN